MKVLFAITVAASVSCSIPAIAETCTAPGHSNCTITCPNGCEAYYWEPNGPCTTRCSSSSTAQTARRFQIVSGEHKGITVREIRNTLRKKQ